MEPSTGLFELATVYYACRDTDALLKTFAGRLGNALDARAVLVWLREEDGDGLACRSAWFAPGERIDPVRDRVTEGPLAEVAGDSATRQFSAEEGDAGELAHLEESYRDRVKAALYAVLPGPRGAVGAVEIINPRRGEFADNEVSFIEEASRITGLALESRLALDLEHRDQLATVERLTALYDISRTFNSTIELEELLPVIADKIRDILAAGACNLWLVDSEAEDLYIVQQSGEDPTVPDGARCPLGEGIVGEAAQTGHAKLVADTAGEESLADRQELAKEFRMETLMCAPLLKDGGVLGIIEVVNKAEGGSFTEEDLFFLSNVCEQAANAIHNANLLEAERKVHTLDALLKISQEITSTLDLDHVLTTVVHQAATVVTFDRCAIGFFDRNRFVLGAVSGEAEVPKTREMEQLRDAMEWMASRKEGTAADQSEEGWQVEPEDARQVVVPFLEEHGYGGFYALPLCDDQGSLGALCLLNGEADFLNESQRETLAILASQISVAIRNAQLYQQVPLAGFLKPLAERKEKLLAIVSGGRWLDWAWKVAAVVGLFIVVPFPMRIGTNATVVPADRRVVTAEAGGIVERVLVREGDRVRTGQLLAELDSSADRVRLAQAETALAQAQRDLADAEFHRDPPAAGQARLRLELHQAEVQYETRRVEDAELVAPIAGVIVTPKLEQKVGTMLKAGDPFCELVDEDRMAAEMNVPETDLPLLRSGTHVALKLNSLPTRTLAARVERIGASTHAEEGEQFFVVRAQFENPHDLARDGMVGSAKIMAGGGWFSSGWYPVGFVLFRTPLRWAWEKAWAWLP